MRKLQVLAGLMLAAVLNCSAQPSYTFTRFQERNGIPSATIEKIIQDADGYLWLASWSGLYRFDGSDFIRFSVNSSEIARVPHDDRLADIEYDGFGRLWVLSSSRTLYRLDPRNRDAERTTPLQVTDIFKLSDTDFRFPTARGTILKCEFSRNGDDFTLSKYFSLPRDETVNLISKDSAGNIWTLTSRAVYRNAELLAELPGLCMLDDGGVQYVGSTSGLLLKVSGDYITILQTETEAPVEILVRIPGRPELLGGSSEEGLFCWNSETERSTRIEGFTATHRPVRQLADSRGNIWLYTERGALYWYDPENMRLVQFYNRELQNGWDGDDYINAVYVDAQDNLWLSGSWGGLEHARYNSGEFKLKVFDRSPDAAPEANNVRAVLQGRSGLIYAATRDGKVHLLDQSLDEVAAWPVPGPVYTLAETADGEIWAGSKGMGITENTARPGTAAYVPRYYRRDDDAYYAPNCDQIYDLNAADPARLWISSFDGSLSYVDLSDDSRQFISRKNRISFPAQRLNRMRHSCFGPDGKLYAGGSLGLFVCGNPSDEPEQMKFENFASTADFDIQHILFTADGRLWASSSGNGFIGFDGTGSDSPAEFYTTREGILSNFVLSAVQDRKGNIWIASNGGINKFNPETNSIIGYPYRRIGLDVQLNEGRPLLAENGEIFFNTTGGLLHFNPDEISNSTYVPKLLINFMSVNGRQKDEDTFDRVRMKRNQTLDLRFLALDLTAPSRVLYYYKVDGLDEDWYNLGNDPFIHLSDLKPGRYTLRLRSTNADGIAVDNERTIRLDVGGGILLLSLLLPPLLLVAAAAAVFLHLRRRASRAAAAPQPFRDSLTAFLEEHIDDGDLSIADVAAAMNMSRSSLFQKCRDKLKMTPLEYLKELRFRKAAEMLQEGSHSISQIAWATGFNDSHYFSRAFKQRFGKTPSEYRNSARRGGAIEAGTEKRS